MFTVGAASSRIHLRFPVRLAGYQARTEPSIAEHDPLYARVLLVESVRDGGRAAMVALDLLCADAVLTAVVRERVAQVASYDPDQVMVCATHTHGGPDLDAPGVREAAAEAAARACEEALSTRTRCALRVGAGTVQAVASRRSEPPRAPGVLGLSGRSDPEQQAPGVGLIDGTLRVAVFTSEDCDEGIPESVAIIANLPCHPTVLGPDNLMVSRDWPGVTVDVCEDELRKAGVRRAVAMFVNGAAADISTRYARRAQTFDECVRIGKIVAHRALELAEAARELGGGGVCLRRERLCLPRRRLPLEEEALEVRARAERAAEELRAQGAGWLDIKEAVDRAAAWRVVLGRVRRAGGATPEPVEAELALLRVGQLEMLFVPGELYYDVGEEIRKALDRGGTAETHAEAPSEGPAEGSSGDDRVWIVGYANGHVGYIAPPTAAADSYEQLMCELAPCAAEMIIAAAAQVSSKGCASTDVGQEVSR
ncbi:MAG: neutral/alkaline non-lysosomal ceramidase N-terminal domain-containing protein [Bacillota bacterium]|jgi:hypothetical protein